MFNNCKDAFVICKYFGFPSFFVTVTCNPEWNEIKKLLKETGLRAKDRPDIISRVFKIKLNQLIRDFKDGSIFGKLSTYVCTIEFQKRGLPHAHILLFMHPISKPKSVDDIDKLISAKIPDKRRRPKLYATVEKFKVHGPCGKYNNKSPCMLNGICSKYFPKPFRARTIIDEAGFPKYRRLDNGRTIRKKNVILDNSYIVPYNPSLLLKYGCHINVEHTCQTSAIKYLFKYVYKGNDRVTASFYQTSEDGNTTPIVDEIQNYYDCRYISSSEAAWRLFGYDIQVKEPTVIRLPFHLPEENPIIFSDSENIEDVTRRTNGKLTKLQAWMIANRQYPYANSLTYTEFPTKFVWKDDISMWSPRKQGFSIGRLTHVPRMNSEDYYLRLLLNIQKRCRSFNDLRILEGVLYSTYKEAYYALGLLQDDKEFIDAIIKASTWLSTNYVRDLFVVLLISYNISCPELVWEKCFNQFSEDILSSQCRLHRSPNMQLTDEQIANLTLAKIEEKMQANGRSLKEFNNTPYPSDEVIDGLDDHIIMDELNFDRISLKLELQRCLQTITDEQQNAFDKILNAVNSGICGFFFVGIAALLLSNGRTAHSRFKIPLSINEDSFPEPGEEKERKWKERGKEVAAQSAPPSSPVHGTMSRASVTKRRREKARCWRSTTRCAAVGPLPSSSKEQGRTTLGLREAEVVWREVRGELFALPFTPPLLSHSAAAARSHCCPSPSKAERVTMELRFCFSGPSREELMGGGRPVQGENAVE
ncbi:uncharacterized protein [Arachis hypogaea]|uniref:uncharacterized protein n=1 Tax=Arachis hypogaea TaxID=3818 RepID=UPI000DEDD689|nr:uncharacterized protein LOC112786147 [Arachis hypogaea]